MLLGQSDAAHVLYSILMQILNGFGDALPFNQLFSHRLDLWHRYSQHPFILPIRKKTLFLLNHGRHSSSGR